MVAYNFINLSNKVSCFKEYLNDIISNSLNYKIIIKM